MEMEVENMNAVENCNIRNCNKNEKEGSLAVRTSTAKKLNVHGYKQFLKSEGSKVKGSDLSIEEKSQLFQSEVNVTEPNGPDKDEKANADDSFSHSHRERLDFLLRRVRDAGRAKRCNCSNSTQIKKKKNYTSETLCNVDKSKLKRKIDRCGALMCKSTKTNFVEYWVPVRLSEMQTEQYCGTLFSNADILCSRSKHGSTEILNDILVSTRKCCDHPYLVDPSLCTSLIRDTPRPELLDTEIKLSNKLLLLHKILLEIRKRGLRVLILYQSLGGRGPFSTGDILDEFIHEKFGRDLIVRIGGSISPSKRRAALDTFNDKENGNFVCLMETRSCIPSIKLTSIDTVIFFNSDWNPMNDMKALRKINLDSQFEHVKVFRLYSSYTLEEKVLILAKQGKAPEIIMSDIKRSTCHQLLTWGATYLFEKLDEFHDGNSIFSNEDSLEDIFHELLELLPNNEMSSSCRNENSFIVEVQEIGGIYPRNISLLGEVESNISLDKKMILKKPHVFWMKLLDGRNPRWKYFSSQSRRTKKSVQRFDDLFEASADPEPVPKKRRKETFYQIPANIKRRIRSKLQNRDRKRKLSGVEKCLQSSEQHCTGEAPLQTVHIASPMRDEVREPNAISEGRISLTQPLEASLVIRQSVCKALQIELEGLQKQKIELLKLHEEKKLQTKMACENEIDQIRKKYDAVFQNAEMALLEEREILEAKYNKVYANKSLAEAVMQRDSAESTTPYQATTNCSMEEIHQHNFQQPGSSPVTRPEQILETLPISSPPGLSVAEGPKFQSPAEIIASRSTQLCGVFFPALPNPVTSFEVASCLPVGQFFNISNQGMIGSCTSLTPFLGIPRASVGLNKISPIRPMSIVPYNFSGNINFNVPASYRVRDPAPHLMHMRPPLPITAPKLSPSPGAGIFSPVSLRPVTSNVQSFQTTGPGLWSLAPLAGLP